MTRARRLAGFGAIASTIPWVVLILWPVSPPPGTRLVYLLPLSDLWNQFTTYSAANLVEQIGGNLAVLLGFGALAPIAWRPFRGHRRVLCFSALVSLGLELLQHAVAAGRVFSVDDVLVNALGGLAGAASTSRSWRARFAGQREDELGQLSHSSTSGSDHGEDASARAARRPDPRRPGDHRD